MAQRYLIGTCECPQCQRWIYSDEKWVIFWMKNYHETCYLLQKADIAVRITLRDYYW